MKNGYTVFSYFYYRFLFSVSIFLFSLFPFFRFFIIELKALTLFRLMCLILCLTSTLIRCLGEPDV